MKIIVKTERLNIALAELDDVEIILSYYERNKEHFRKSMMAYPSNFFTKDYWKAYVESALLDFDRGINIRLFAFINTSIHNSLDVKHGGIASPIAHANLTNITRGAFHACFLGYGLDREHLGNGYMFEAVSSVINYAFSELNLHRIMANYMPSNKRSERLLEKLGFAKEGYAKDYLFLDNVWEDHIMTSLINKSWIK